MFDLIPYWMWAFIVFLAALVFIVAHTLTEPRDDCDPPPLPHPHPRLRHARRHTR
jgi:hypothetical protein